MTVSCVGITEQLNMLTKLAEAGRDVIIANEIARTIAGPRSRHETINLIIDELWRRHTYVADVDIDDACLFVATVAKGFGIRCRFTMARYDRASWTLFVAYENEEGLWQNINVLRQKTDQVPNELVMGPIPGDAP